MICEEGSFHRNVYGEVPPAGFEFTLPSQLVEHEVVIVPLGESESAVGCEIVSVWLTEQPFASRRIRVLVPAHSPVAVGAVCDPAFQSYVYGEVPPVGLEVAVPLQVPLQSAGVVVTEAVSTPGDPTTAAPITVQPTASVMVTE